MFELSLANWPPVARILQEDVSVPELNIFMAAACNRIFSNTKVRAAQTGCLVGQVVWTHLAVLQH